MCNFVYVLTLALQDSEMYRVESAIMRQVVLWDTACNFNAIILNQSIFNCLITSASTLNKIVSTFEQFVVIMLRSTTST